MKWIFQFLLLFCCIRLHGELPREFHFEETLLIINYNHPHYESIPFLKDHYSKAFPHIVIYGEQAAEGVHQITTEEGFFGQNVISDAMRRYPNYKGYLCVQDDCWINFWNLTRLDQDKIWFSPLVGFLAVDDYWEFWNFPCGKDAVTKVLAKIPEKYKRVLEANVGKDRVGYTVADFVYIPGRLREGYIELCALFLTPPTFVELAVPNILLSLESFKKWQILNVYWGIEDVPKEYHRGFDWFHPIKFSKQENRDFIHAAVDKWFLDYPG